MECDRPGAPTFCLDFYAGLAVKLPPVPRVDLSDRLCPRFGATGGKSPAFGPVGVIQQPTQADVVVVYRETNERIDKVWVGADAEGLARLEDASEADVVDSAAFKAVRGWRH